MSCPRWHLCLLERAHVLGAEIMTVIDKVVWPRASTYGLVHVQTYSMAVYFALNGFSLEAVLFWCPRGRGGATFVGATRFPLCPFARGRYS